MAQEGKRKMRRLERVDRGVKVRSESIYVLSSAADLAYLLAPRALLVLSLLLLPVGLSPWPYWQRVAISALLIALLGISFDFLANFIGLVSLGGALFFGAGAYAAVLLGTRAGWPAAATLPAAAVLGAAVSTLLLLPCLRLRGIYFTVTTLVYPLLAVRLIEATDVWGGSEGLRGLKPLPPWVETWLPVAVVLAALFALRRYVVEPPGLVLRAIRDNDQAVRAAGISVTFHRTVAVFVAALLGSFAGAFYAYLYGSVGVSAFALDLSVLPIAVTLVGGSGTLVGPLVGSFFLVPLGELLRDFGSLRIALYALVLVAFVVLKNEGIFPFAARKYQQTERWVEL